MAYRNDPSSLSFGRRLQKAELDAAEAKRELKELKESLPQNNDLQAAALAGDVIKQQRRSAKQLMGQPGVTLEDLNSIDPSVLTPMFQEQLRHSKNDAAWLEMPLQSQGFQFQTPQAQQRFEQWQASYVTNPQQQADFATSNLAPEQETPFQKWDRRQKSPSGRMWNQQRRRAEYDKDLLKARHEQSKKQKPKTKGARLGGLKGFEE